MAESSGLSGGFFGGLSTGIGEARTAALAQQKQQALDANDVRTAATKQIESVFGLAKEMVAATAAAGKDPSALLQQIEPMIASLTTPMGPGKPSIADAAGIPAARLGQMATLLVQRPPLEDPAAKPVKVAPGDSLVHPTTGKVVYSSPPLDPLTGKPIGGQPVLSQSEVITPGQAAAANPPAPVAPAPVAAAPDGTPAQTVAQRFPSPAQGGPPAVSVQQPAAPTGPTLPPGMEPGSEAVQYALKNNIVGPGFMAAVPLQLRNTLSGLVEYKVDPDKLSKRTDKSGQSEYTRMLGLTHQLTSGDYDPKWYRPIQKAISEFTSGGQTSPAGQITVGNTAIAHGGQVADGIDKLKAVPGLLQKMEASNTPFVSYAAAQLKNQSLRGTSEGAALQAFLTASHHFVDETTKFYAGGQPAEAGRARGLENFNAANSEHTLYQALNSEAELLHGKVDALQDRWKNAVGGPKALNNVVLRNAIPDFPILSEKSVAALDRIGQGYLASKYKGKAPGGAPVVDFRTYFGGQ